MPIRIQRQRTRGWRMPEGAIYVGRPTIFGNPYPVSICGLEAAMQGYRDLMCGCFNPQIFAHLSGSDFHKIYLLYSKWQKTHMNIRAAIEQLRGYDLACWCPLSRPCHVDILLEINQ